MRILLDTHVWLWMLTEPARLGDAARALLEDAEHTLHLSAASTWEIAIKYALGRLPLPEPPAAFVTGRLARDGVLPLPIEHRHAAHVAELPPHHRDPFDRLLVAQARLEEMTLVTADRALQAYEVAVVLAG